MAKSIFEILSTGVIEVAHRGEEVVLDLPEWFTTAGAVLTNEEGLLQWAAENGCLLALLQTGLQKTIIDIRAAARPDEKTSILDDKAGAQARVLKFKLTELRRPGSGTKNKALSAALLASVKSMLDANLGHNLILQTLSAGFGRPMVLAAIEELTAEN